MNEPRFVKPEELETRDRWVNQHLLHKEGGLPPAVAPGSGDLPFSFVYNGKSSRDFLAGWPVQTESKALDRDRTQRTFTWTDPQTGLEVRCVSVEYADFPVVEWTLYLRNTGQENTPILESIQALDADFQRDERGQAVLHTNKGDWYAAEGYEPYRCTLNWGTHKRFAPCGGRPTNGPEGWPYYNLELQDGGVILAVGWPGQWASEFICEEGWVERGLRVVAGQELTHLYLKPGEMMRTPLIALLFWQGSDLARSQNIWRRWMVAHNLPRPGGKLPEPILPAYTGRWFSEMALATEETQIAFFERYVEEGIRLDYWWMDAGWYPCEGDWTRTGTWEPDPVRFPRGLRAISDHCREKGAKTIVWFEPERVTPGSWLAQQHPEWLLDGILLNLGNPEALHWLIEHISKVITEQGIDLYRQDFNMNPLDHWRGADAPDRQGMTEMRYVEGYLTFWGALRKRFPGMLIDSCSSGGRRNDLETLRLAVPLHKTDYNYDDLPTKQAFHHSLSAWLPYYGAYVLPVDTVDTYAFRSSLALMTMLTYDLRRRDIDWRPLKALTEEWRRITSAGYFYGDYFPLTAYSRELDQWIAWQFDRPEQGIGLIQAFRREQCEEPLKTLRLCGLDPAAQYEVANLDAQGSTIISGQDLMEKGLKVEIKDRPGAAVILYRRAG
jgi:alpha-galactosidase